MCSYKMTRSFYKVNSKYTFVKYLFLYPLDFRSSYLTWSQQLKQPNYAPNLKLLGDLFEQGRSPAAASVLVKQNRALPMLKSCLHNIGQINHEGCRMVLVKFPKE